MKKTGSLMMLGLLIAGSVFAPLNNIASANNATGKTTVSATTSANTTSDATEDEDADADEEATDEEKTDESEDEAVEEVTPIEAKVSMGEADLNGEKVTTTKITASVDPTTLGIDTKVKAKLQFNLCGYDSSTEECAKVADFSSDLSKAFVVNAKAKLMDGTEVPVQVSVQNKSGELTKLSANNDLYKPATDSVKEQGYGFYNMVVDLGESDAHQEPIEITVEILGDLSSFTKEVKEKSLGIGRLAIISGVSDITNVPVNLAEEAVEEPEDLPELPEKDLPPIIPVSDVKESDTGIAGGVAAVALLLGGGALYAQSKRRKEE